VQKFTILPHDFSVDGEELTPTLKTKRSVVDEKYHEQIEAMYASKDTFVNTLPSSGGAAAEAK
jgi:long-subunit acyl-CoA synthetase (AMP-forming)